MDPSSLDQTLHKYKIELPEKQSALLERYCNQLWQWNEKINLTRHLDFERFVARDVTDSLALADIIEPDEEILDVGTGGGVPGIVVAILRPDVQVTLCESSEKKSKCRGRHCRESWFTNCNQSCPRRESSRGLSLPFSGCQSGWANGQDTTVV